MHSTQETSITMPSEMERENAIEHWLRTEVAATYDAYSKAKPLDETWQRLEARMNQIDREKIDEAPQ
ncbi:hypothetical protein ATY78_07940 [Rhizobium sp. R635]|uniref:hypothetical protein n=1 Tax=Rhizobium sp. R635 TaxID=1764275 RepID=UPI000B52A4D5|nr:hypothetical protein [Rhizobium sp. R635]OWV80604.1 hypothetical protein ATY78_07940 [Rhizobium sp. R635]